MRAVAKFTTKIGFPDKWKDHSRLGFTEGDGILELRRKVAAFELQSEFCTSRESQTHNS